MEGLTLLEKCRLVAYYGDISEANRRRWSRGRARKTIAEIMAAKPSNEKAPGD